MTLFDNYETNGIINRPVIFYFLKKKKQTLESNRADAISSYTFRYTIKQETINKTSYCSDIKRVCVMLNTCY